MGYGYIFSYGCCNGHFSTVHHDDDSALEASDVESIPCYECHEDMEFLDVEELVELPIGDVSGIWEKLPT